MRRFWMGLAIAALSAMTPVCGLANDQQIADYVKNRLAMEQQNGNLRGFNVDMRVENGTIWLSGQVSSEAQEQLVLSTAQQASHLGAKQVVDDIEVRGADMVQQASVMQPPMGMMAQAAPVNYQEPAYNLAPGAIQQQAPPAMQMAPPPASIPNYGYGAQGIQAQPASAPMPMPAGYASGNPMATGGSPNLPGYAWPGYAAYPNYAAVNYPQQYSASAWPYIGPFYPYPQVPLGWRKVQLEWDDGWWYLNFRDR